MPPSKSTATAPLPHVLEQLRTSYWANTTQELKIIDAYLVYIMATGILQFVYCLAVSSFPYNAFLAGFGCSVATFVFVASLRIRVNPKNTEFSNLSPQRAFAEFLVCQMVLHFILGITHFIDTELDNIDPQKQQPFYGLHIALVNLIDCRTQLSFVVIGYIGMDYNLYV
ncbi:Dolichyl-diphosphooligosaccharide-protein glycosyltransferase subunit dad1 [Tieghemiomyces parasiticus]|uniref:Dolichyl-diphosphooligosaccharide--protein glycosyltransferase subunit OST2 n=1 Tax=Tieghemiomyces parasiticus TaxID=78921 RepID=A0A9W8AB91_9FUNG|nr:Dolichyl-diphosphooligosaccharide-protein glycosyltransferase subunit dad1 [Tieghemiomyces parasiticus]